jgi:hypothetical protein
VPLKGLATLTGGELIEGLTRQPLAGHGGCGLRCRCRSGPAGQTQRRVEPRGHRRRLPDVPRGSA